MNNFNFPSFSFLGSTSASASSSSSSSSSAASTSSASSSSVPRLSDSDISNLLLQCREEIEEGNVGDALSMILAVLRQDHGEQEIMNILDEAKREAEKVF